MWENSGVAAVLVAPAAPLTEPLLKGAIGLATPQSTKSVIQCQLKLRLRPAQERLLNRWLWRLTGAYNWALLKLIADHRDGIRYTKFDVAQLVRGHGAKSGVSQDALEGTVVGAFAACDKWWSGRSRRPRMKGRRNRLNSIALPHGGNLRELYT